MKRFFTSDMHLHHENIIRYSDRPFKNAEEMNEEIIRRFNERVKSEDIVYDLGDRLFKGKDKNILNRLNGKIIHICGNHDGNNSVSSDIQKCYLYIGNEKICLVHNPEYADPECKINLVGHVHKSWKIRRLGYNSIMLNVGVDQWNYYPITLEEAFNYISNWKKSTDQQYRLKM